MKKMKKLGNQQKFSEDKKREKILELIQKL
jgi:hypothetical protein